MSEEQFKAFLEKVQGDTSLQDNLKAAADAEAIVVIAKEAGFSISVDDLTKAQSELSEELSEEELEGVAGGMVPTIINSLWYCFKPGDLENRRRGGTWNGDKKGRSKATNCQ